MAEARPPRGDRRTERISVTVPLPLLQGLEARAEEEHRSLSNLVGSLLANAMKASETQL